MIANDVYIAALKLMGEDSETGTDSGYTTEYQAKAWAIITILQAELLPHVVPAPITNSTTTLQVSDWAGRMILPYGLAAHLLMEEDQNRAAFFNARYDELKRKRPVTIQKITDVYGVTYGEGM